MVIDGEGTYVGDTNHDKSLTAINRVKSGINVWKHVYAQDGTTEIYPNTEFTITGHLLDKNGNPFTWSEGDDVNKTGAYHIYGRDGKARVEKAHFDSTGAIELKLKAGEYARFINVPQGCTFSFTENLSSTDNDYALMSLQATMQKRDASGAYVTEDNPLLKTNKEKKTATLESSGIVGDKQYSVVFNNKRLTPFTQNVRFRKVALVNQQNSGLADAEFNLSIGDKRYVLTSKADGYMWYVENGKQKSTVEMPVSLNNKAYTLVETKAPDGYLKIDGDITIQVTNSGVMATSIVDGRTTNYEVVKDATGDGTVYTIVIPNKDGSELPATGGTGTTAFYLVGAALFVIGLCGLSRGHMATRVG
jgi:LPXTG-motif cell wall-anchored protein